MLADSKIMRRFAVLNITYQEWSKSAPPIWWIFYVHLLRIFHILRLVCLKGKYKTAAYTPVLSL